MEKKYSKPVLGLVGGIGSGKSTVADIFRQVGCSIIDADKIGHQVLEDKDVRKKIFCIWPDAEKEDSSIDRSVIAKSVFSDPHKLDILNSIVRPAITQKIRILIEEYLQNESISAIIIDAAILFEAGWDRMCDEVLFVDCDDEIRYQRVSKSRGWDKKMWVQREKSQISLDKKRNVCKHILINRSSVSHLRDQVRKLYPRLFQ